MDKVDNWMLVNNAHTPRVVIADKQQIYDEELYKRIKAYVTE